MIGNIDIRTVPWSTKALMARALVQYAPDNVWSFQGFGMFRMYLSPNVRLHVWVPELVDNVYKFHSHIDGLWESQEIKCGPGGGPVKGMRKRMMLGYSRSNTYYAGDVYALQAHQVHESIPNAGTITLIERRPLADPDHATVFYEAAKGWVSPEPRPATAKELAIMRQAALSITLPEHLR